MKWHTRMQCFYLWASANRASIALSTEAETLLCTVDQVLAFGFHFSKGSQSIFGGYFPNGPSYRGRCLEAAADQ